MANVHGDGQPGKPGLDSRRVIRQDGWELSVWGDMPDGEPRIRDLDLAKRLGFKQPRMIRKLIKSVFVGNKRPYVRDAVERTSMPRGGTRETRVNEYWLTEKQALIIVTSSRTPIAAALTEAIIDVFLAVKAGLATTTPTKSQVLALLLAPEFLPPPPGGRFKEDLYFQIFRMWDKPYPRDVRGSPQGKWLGNIIVDLFYLRLSGDSSLIEELRRRNPANESGNRRHRHHSGLRHEIADGPLRAMVDIAIALMRSLPRGAWNEFIVQWDRLYPVHGRTAWLPVSIAPQLPPPRAKRARRPRPGRATGSEGA